jgi:hypothetical protein
MEARLGRRTDEQIAPHRHHVQPLATVPGVSDRTAEVVLAEIGADVAAASRRRRRPAGHAPGGAR